MFDHNDVPHTAGNSYVGGQFKEFAVEEDRAGRNRKRHAYASNEISPNRSRSYESGSQAHNGDHTGRFDSLILAKRIKNENSRMLQSLESRFSILQRNE